MSDQTRLVRTLVAVREMATIAFLITATLFMILAVSVLGQVSSSITEDEPEPLPGYTECVGEVEC